MEDICDPQTGEVLISQDTMMTADDAKLLEAHGIYEVKIRSVLTCEPAAACAPSATASTWPSVAGGRWARRWASSPPSPSASPAPS